MKFKDSLIGGVLMPTMNNGGTVLRAEGLIMDTNDRNSSCTVKFRNQKNKIVTKTNVFVKSGSPSLIDWFPSAGDRVIVEVINSEPIVIGESITRSRTNNQSKSSLNSDIYTDNMGAETMGGYIF